ncbi:hypothetical protein EOI86_22640 [Hwanghaeella grinnelliae]|uniref:Uncharacterized protein n=1 Tax=Hwanghaeella grinnelliae TaxID=2500179 RepID=A0A3S2Y084_9PROT|nr:ethanolamine ammonia-lyase reactivating factor EutA [Hwanghaeella grinnelliae]RVU33929.1 hypothetical protein EOI86_22640 [Hwanghaeella grinnelliae]
MATFFVHELRNDKGGPPEGGVGRFHKHDIVHLANVASLTKDTKRTDDAFRGIGNVWARIIDFHDALQSKDEKLRKPAVRLWRGLIALLAVSQIRQFGEVHVAESIFGSKKEENPIVSIAAKQAPAFMYGQTEAADLPSENVKLGAFFLENRIVALLNPHLLVLPSENIFDLLETLAPKIGWIKGNLDHPADKVGLYELFEDFLAPGAASVVDIAVVKHFVQSIYDIRVKQLDDAKLDQDLVQRLLNEFNLELNDHLDNRTINLPVVTDNKLRKKISDSLGFPDANEIKWVSGFKKIYSDTLLIGRDAKSPFVNAVFFDPAMAQNVSLGSEEDLLVVGPYTLGALNKLESAFRAESTINCLRKGMQTLVVGEQNKGDDGVGQIFTLDDIFANKLVIFTSGCVQSPMPSRASNFLLPITRTALDFLDPTYANEWFKIETEPEEATSRSGERSVTASIILQLGSNIDDAIVTWEISKKYSVEDGTLIVGVPRPSVLAVEPGINAAYWRNYITFACGDFTPADASDDGSYVSLVSDVFTPAMASKSASKIDEDRYWHKQTKVGVDPTDIWSNHRMDLGPIRSSSQKGKEVLRYFRTQELPEAFEVNVLHVEVNSNLFVPIANGIVPFGAPPEPGLQASQAECVIAFDFGTTNTMIAIAVRQRNAPSPLKKPKIVSSTLILDDYLSQAMVDPESASNARVNIVLSKFFPARNLNYPMPSVAVKTVLPVNDPDGAIGSQGTYENSIPFSANRIQFFPTRVFPAQGENTERDTVSLLREVAEDVKFLTEKDPSIAHYSNLKWSDITDSRNRDVVLGYFIHHLFHISLTQTQYDISPESIKWVFTYPRAMNKSQKEQLQRLFEEAVAKVLNQQTVSPDGKHKKKHEVEVRYAQESQALAAYRRKHPSFNNKVKSVVVAIDIGGQTSDIAVLKNGHAIWHQSLMVGGRGVLVEYLANHLSDLHDLLGDLKLKSHPLGPLMEFLRSGYADENRRNREHDIGSSGYLRQKILESLEVFLASPAFAAIFEEYRIRITSSQLFQEVSKRASATLAVILYYVSKVLKQLDMNKDGADGAPLEVLLCGRGSLIFRNFCRVGVEEHEDDHEMRPILPDDLDKALSIAFKEAELKWTKDSISFSEHPKEEVALGAALGWETFKSDTYSGGDKIEERFPQTDKFVLSNPRGKKSKDVLKAAFTGGLKLDDFDDIEVEKVDLSETFKFLDSIGEVIPFKQALGSSSDKVKLNRNYQDDLEQAVRDRVTKVVGEYSDGRTNKPQNGGAATDKLDYVEWLQPLSIFALLEILDHWDELRTGNYTP